MTSFFLAIFSLLSVAQIESLERLIGCLDLGSWHECVNAPLGLWDDQQRKIFQSFTRQSRPGILNFWPLSIQYASAADEELFC